MLVPLGDAAAEPGAGAQRRAPRHSSGGNAEQHLRFRYRGGYWEERAAGRYTGCRDIFGPDVVPMET